MLQLLFTNYVCQFSEGFEYVGQNLGFYTRSNENFDFKRTLRSLIMYWYNEVELFQREWVNYTDDRSVPLVIIATTDMTRLVQICFRNTQ